MSEAKTQLTGTGEIKKAGQYSFEIKDTGGNVTTVPIVAYPIKLNATPDLAVWDVKFIEGETEVVTDFALAGTTFSIATSIDSHYEDKNVTINTALGDSLDTFIVDQEVEINLSCIPKDYWVAFDLGGKGDIDKAPDQLITYLHTVKKPAEQYNFATREVIEGWYLSKDYTDASKWDFERDIIKGDTTLYAK